MLFTAKLAKKQPQTNYSKEKPSKAGSTKSTLDKVLGMHKAWLGYRAKLLKGFERDTKLYNNERVTENRYKGVSDSFVPMTYSTIETMVAALATGDLSTDFIPQDIYKYFTDRLASGYTGEIIGEDGLPIEETQEEYMIRAIREVVNGEAIEDENLEILNALYDYHWASGDWDMELEYLIRSGLKIGSGAWWLTWEVDRPCLTTVPFPDFIFDPTGKSDGTARYMGRRYLADIDDLRKIEIIDPETGEKKKRYKIPSVTGQKENSGKNDKSDKELKEEMLFGSTVTVAEDEESKQGEIIEIMTADNTYTVLNRKYLIEEAENPFKAQAALRGIDYTGIIPGITWANNKDESLFVGRSETSTFWQEQERLNDVTNQKSDAVTRALLQQRRADPALKSQKESFNVPGAVIWATAGQYDTVPQDQVPSVAFSEENSIKNNIREVTATDQIVKGVGSTTGVTATEAKLQVAQAGQRIELKIRSLEKGPLKRLARLTFQMYRLFITDPFIVPVSANKGIKPYLYNPKNYVADFEPKIQLTIDSQNRRRQEQQSSVEFYKLLISDETNNRQEVKRIYLPKITDMDKDEVKRVTEPGEQAGAPQETGIPQLPPQLGAV